MSDPMPQAPRTGSNLAAVTFRKYKAELHRWLVRRLRSPETADDIAQEVFSRAVRVENVEYVRKPLSYLFGIAFHVISEYQIREEQDRIITYDSSVVDQMDNHPSMVVQDEFADRLNLQRQIEAALAELPAPYRTVLLLCKREGMTYEEAAAASGLSVHTVEKYLVRAKAMIMAKTWDR